MSNDDRGTYSPPTEDNLSYETRRPAARDQPPVTLIVSAICLVVLLVIVVVLYSSGLNKRGKIAPEVGDSIGDFKSGQVQDAKPLPDTDLSLDNGQSVSFAAGAETPSSRTTDKDIAPPPAAPINGPLPSQTGNAPVQAGPVQAAPVQAAPVQSGPVQSGPVQPASSQAPLRQDNASAPVAPKPVVKAPAATSAASSSSVAAARPAVSGGNAVQIGAYDSTGTADAEYARVASSYGLFVGGAGKKVEKVTTANGTFYRTLFTGLSADKAHAFCAALKANGRDCILR